MIFELCSEEIKKLNEWDKHECTVKNNQGAIGGRLTFFFTPTSLGTIIKVKCGCGEEIDLTDYSW